MNRNWKDKFTSYALCCNDDVEVFLSIFHETQGLNKLMTGCVVP